MLSPSITAGVTAGILSATPAELPGERVILPLQNPSVGRPLAGLFLFHSVDPCTAEIRCTTLANHALRSPPYRGGVPVSLQDRACLAFKSRPLESAPLTDAPTEILTQKPSASR